MFLNTLDLPAPPENTRVVVAMSGGVDSSVVAALLKREGYDVLGITLQLYDDGRLKERVGSCCAGQDVDDARRVCEILDIPHYVLDYEKRFHEAVITPFAQSYSNGETPIPCIFCNQSIKFKDLLETADELRADALATGHYVRSVVAGGSRALYLPVDLERDQSYFLFATTQCQLDYLRFPLGTFLKSEVRKFAEEIGLPVAHKCDSQDICFVHERGYASVVSRLNPEARNFGKIVHIDGRILGDHPGIFHFTVGQRRGLGIATGEALYVVYLDALHSRVIVGPKEALKTHKIYLRNINWLGSGDMLSFSERKVEMAVKIRSTQRPCSAILHSDVDGFWIELPCGAHGVASGQACVFYSDITENARVLGGGFITHSERTPETEFLLKALLKRDLLS